MKLHELERDKEYLGEDGRVYVYNGEYLVDLDYGQMVVLFSLLTQDFIPLSTDYN